MRIVTHETIHGEEAEFWGNDGEMVRITISHADELDALGGAYVAASGPLGWLLPDSRAVHLMEDTTIREFMGAIGFLPDPDISGTWYQLGAACNVRHTARAPGPWQFGIG